MKYIINFFEVLDLNLIHSNFEFETNNEQITVTVGNDCYYFLFSNVDARFRSNLCREIIFVNENQYDLKLFKSNTELGKYFQEKFKISQTNENFNKNNDEEFIIGLEKHLLTLDNFNKILLKLKIEENLPEKVIKNDKKIKI